jgi:glycoside/pentoside/hexuronide:cation symporter, GPH family
MTTPTPAAPNPLDPNNRRVPNRELAIYSIGGIASSYSWTVNALTNPIFNMELKVSLVWLGLVLAINRVIDAITDLIIGYWSDRLVTRWGRRRPLILVGGLIVAFCYGLMWMFPRDLTEMGFLLWYGLVSVVFYVGTTLYGTGYWALGVELTSGYHERTRVVAWRSYVGAFAGLTTPWFLWVVHHKEWFPDPITGVRWLGGTVALAIAASSVPVALFCKERYAGLVAHHRQHISFLRAIEVTFTNREFLRLTGVGLLMMASLTLFEQFAYYVNFFYVFGGDKSAATLVGAVAGNVGWGCGLAGIPLIQWVSKRLGKHVAVRLALLWMILGCALKWWCYTPAHPWLQLVIPFFYSIGIAAFFTILPSMSADVIDTDELITGERREAMFNAVGNLVNKIASAGAVAATGFIMAMTGFVVEKGGDQTVETFTRMRFMYSFASAVVIGGALLLVWRYTLTRDRLLQVQAELARRRAANNA